MPQHPSIKIRTYADAAVTVQTTTDRQAQQYSAIKAFEKSAGEKAINALYAHGLSEKSPVVITFADVLASVTDTRTKGDDGKCEYHVEDWVCLKIG